MATFLPISLNITDKQILIVGGGRIASHKIGFLEQFTRNIRVVALDIQNNIKDKGYPIFQKPYEKSDLHGIFIVYACTNIPELNESVRRDSASMGILCNVVDNPQSCDFVSPAIYKKGMFTVACGSNGQNVRKAIEIRDTIKEFLETHPCLFLNT